MKKALIYAGVGVVGGLVLEKMGQAWGKFVIIGGVVVGAYMWYKSRK